MNPLAASPVGQGRTGVLIYTGRHPHDEKGECVTEFEDVRAFDGLDPVGELWLMTGLLTPRWKRFETPVSMRRAA